MKCCFCNREITKNAMHNPEPLSEDFDAVCCAECNISLVSPTRKIVWRAWVGQRNAKKILAGLRRLSIEEMRDILKDAHDIRCERDFETWLIAAKKAGVVH